MSSKLDFIFKELSTMTYIPEYLLTPSSQPRLMLLLAYPGVGLLDLTGPQCVFWTATRYMEKQGLSGYNPQTVSLNGGLVNTAEGIAVNTASLSDFAGKTVDTIVVPGSPYMPQVMEECQYLESWLRQNSKNARRTASVCSGAFLLAQAGLLDGKRTATHWAMCDLLQDRFPTLSIDRDAIFIEDGSVWTCAGVSAGIDLALAFVNADCGHAIAMKVARELVVFLKRPGGQAQFSEMLQSQEEDTSDFEELHLWIAENIGENLTVELLAEKVLMSPRNFARVYKQKTGRTPAKTIELFRLEAARRLLEDSERNVDQVARLCGFDDEERMRITFQRNLAISPSEYRKHFAR
jgi:transcriptional regulator GlxA family with amidase domain